MAVSKLSPIEDFTESKEKIKNFYINENYKYYMLLNNDIRYYTLFHRFELNNETMEDVIIECLQDLGVIKMIDNDTDKIECWIDSEEYGTIVLYLFPYDRGVVEVI